MARLCERPGCAQIGEIAYGFDTTLLLVWLHPLDPAVDPNRAGVLCLRHADSMVLPRGWSLDDARDAVPRLFRPKLVADTDESAAGATGSAQPGEPPTARRPRRRAGSRRRPERQLRFQAVVDAADSEELGDVGPAASTGAGVPPTVVAVDEIAPAVADDTAALTVANVTGLSMKPEPDAIEAMPWKPDYDSVVIEDDDVVDAANGEVARAAVRFDGADRRRR